MVNLILRKKAKQIKYIIHTVDNINAVSFEGVYIKFYRYITDIPIKVNDIIVLSFIYVVEMINDTYNIILGAPF